MSFLLKLLSGSLGPYIAGGVGAILALALAFAGIQSARLHHAKADLSAARAALKDPATHKTWQAEARAAQSDLATCHGNVERLTGSVAAQNARVDAMKAEGDARLAAATKAVSEALRGRDRAVSDARAILARKLPSAPAENCAAADALILESVR